MHILLDGTVRVVRGDGETIATGRGEVVGEMSVITRAPHVATLVAEGDVRTLHIGYREFEAMVHERPDIALAVMRVLAERLGARPPNPSGSGLSVRFSEPSPPGIGQTPAASNSKRVLAAPSPAGAGRALKRRPQKRECGGGTLAGDLQ